MILRSDNTATDMIFNLAGADNIRRLIALAGLLQTRVPDNTRIFAGYLFGAPNYKTITWDELLKVAGQGRIANAFPNDVETLASTAEDFVKYYWQALHGSFFQHGETLQEFRRILTLCDFIYLVPIPLGGERLCQERECGRPRLSCEEHCGGHVLCRSVGVLCLHPELVCAGRRGPTDGTEVLCSHPRGAHAREGRAVLS
jgi:hypothetical protein